MAGAFREHGLVAEGIDLLADGVAVNELRVAEDRRGHAEEFLDLTAVLDHLVEEFRRGGHRREGMVIGLAEELHATRLRQGAETVDHLRRIALELLQHRTGEREGHPELAAAEADLLQQERIHREIALLGDAAQDGPVGKVVIVVGVLPHIEETVQAQPGGLVDLEIHANAFLCHNLIDLGGIHTRL